MENLENILHSFESEDSEDLYEKKMNIKLCETLEKYNKIEEQ